MRRVVVIKAKTPPDVFKTGKKVLVKQLPPTAKAKPKPALEQTANHAQEDSGEVGYHSNHQLRPLDKQRLVGGLFDSDDSDGDRRRRRRRRRRRHFDSDESSDWEDSESDNFNWDPRRSAEIIAKHRGVNNYVNALKAEINGLQERLEHEGAQAPGTQLGVDTGQRGRRLVFYQQQNRSVCRRLRRSVRQCVRLQMRLAKHSIPVDEPIVEEFPYWEISDTLAGGRGGPCRCTKALCVLVEALEELVPAHESSVWETRIQVVSQQRDKLFNELMAVRDRLTEIQLIVNSDPFLQARINSSSLGLDINCALNKEEQQLIMMRKIQGLEMLVRELENQLLVEKTISQQWRPELRKLSSSVAKAFSEILSQDINFCEFSEKMASVVDRLSNSEQLKGGSAEDSLKLRVRQDAKRIQFYVERISELERQVVFLTNPSREHNVSNYNYICQGDGAARRRDGGKAYDGVQRTVLPLTPEQRLRLTKIEPLENLARRQGNDANTSDSDSPDNPQDRGSIPLREKRKAGSESHAPTKSVEKDRARTEGFLNLPRLPFTTGPSNQDTVNRPAPQSDQPGGQAPPLTDAANTVASYLSRKFEGLFSLPAS